MKVLHLSTSDIEGGAARAAYRLHQGLQSVGVDSQMLVRAKSSIDRAVIRETSLLTKLGPPSSSLPLKFYPNRSRTRFESQWFPDTLSRTVKKFNPDVVHLHWICNGFVQIETLAKLNKPLIWTLHDMWPFTGGCHYAENCNHYTRSCGTCPQLKSRQSWDLSRWVWQRKNKVYRDIDLTIVSPSHWLADCAKSSSLFQNLRIEVILHGLDLEKYKPVDKQIARKLLNLPLDKQLVLFGASPGTTADPRKGLQFLQPALQQLKKSGWKDRFELIIFGGSQSERSNNFDFTASYLGQFHDDLSLALVYSAADVMVVPSTQEAFGQTASEAMACGTPVVAFNATGLKDIVDHQQNGYLAQPFEIDDLAFGVAWVLENPERCHQLALGARQKVEKEFHLESQSRRYLSLYNQITSV